MRFQQFEQRYVVRLESGEAAIEALTAFLRAEGIAFASVTAAGTVRWARPGYWNAETQQYEYQEFDEQLEVVSFQGNASLKDGAPFLHIHGVFARRDFSTIGGHIKEVRVHPTLEVWLRAEDVSVRRAPDPATGLDLLELPELAGRGRGPRTSGAPAPTDESGSRP